MKAIRWVIVSLLVLFTCSWSAPAFAKKKKDTLVQRAMEAAKAALVTAPKDGEVCFSPEEPCDVKLIKFIQTAEKSIDVAIYDINLDQFVHQLLVASKKLKVRVLADCRQAKGNHSLVPLLIKAGADLRYGRQRGIFHNKFVIVDGKRLETGSFNFTNHAARANSENQIYLADAAIVERYRTQFETLWSKADPPSDLDRTATP